MSATEICLDKASAVAAARVVEQRVYPRRVESLRERKDIEAEVGGRAHGELRRAQVRRDKNHTASTVVRVEEMLDALE
jgi:hypothetical protein